MNEKIAILGGAFNPVHLGHLLIAQNALKALPLDRVLFMPSSIPPDKRCEDRVEDHHRAEMIRRAIQGEPRFELSTLELDRGGVSYSVETLRQLEAIHPGAEFFWIIGSDRFETLGTWHQFPELIRCCSFLVMERPGTPLKHPPSPIFGEGKEAVRFQIFQGPTVDISSTRIREDLKLGKNVSQFVPSAVYQYLQKYRIYQNTL